MASGKQLRKALKVNDLTMEAGAEKLGISRQTLYNACNRAELDEDFVQNVNDKLGIDLNAEPVPFIQQRRNQKLSDDPYMVPFVDIPAQAGYTKAYQQSDYIATLKKFPILPDVEPHGAVWRYFQIAGDSMEKPNPGPGEDEGLRHGDTILCSQVPKEDWLEVKDKYTHVIVTDDNMWIKDVHIEGDEIWLLSQNPTYKAFSVPLSEVRQIWALRRHVKNRVKKTRMYDMDEIRKQIEESKNKK